MVYRIFVEKKPGLRGEADGLLSDIRGFLGIKSVSGVRIVNRYDAENITAELFETAKNTVFSEPQLDDISDALTGAEGKTVFAVEFLPGQFDQRADSAAQCIQIISCGDRPTVKTAKVYVIDGDVSEAELAQIKGYVINPVESREASLDMPETLAAEYDIPETVETLDWCKYRHHL